MDRKRKSKGFISFVKLLDCDTHEVFYDKLTFVYMELPRFKKKVEELETGVERWMYVLKHLARLSDLPEGLQNRIFKKVFEQAKIANMSREEYNDYQQSLKNYRDMYQIENEWKMSLQAKDRIIASMRKDYKKDLAAKEKDYQKDLAAKEKDYQQALARIAELEQKFGKN